jgi:flavin reductase (DIM6/NTAB) family NADH-FMN oxidoreductase RutF
MSIDGMEFRRALGQFATGITVVTTRGADGRPQGLTVNAFASVSLEPPLVLVCIDRRSEVHAGLAQAGRFNVSVLGETQEAFSRRFAGGGPMKFEGIDLPLAANGLPAIPEALAVLQCRLAAVHEAGDHVIYVGEVDGLDTRPGPPLVYHGSAYRRLASVAQS